MSLTRVLSAVLVSGALFVAVPAEAKTTPTPTKTSVVHHTAKKAHKKSHKKHVVKKQHAKATHKTHKKATSAVAMR
jgi:hypothetical protein